jgi:2'-5' RNA ligase
VSGHGTFGRPPHVFVAHFDVERDLLDLHGAVCRTLASAGVEPERRQWRPHVTLARLRRPGCDALARLRERAVPVESAVADRVVLFASELHPTGARYRCLAGVPLHER